MSFKTEVSQVDESIYTYGILTAGYGPDPPPP